MIIIKFRKLYVFIAMILVMYNYHVVYAEDTGGGAGTYFPDNTTTYANDGTVSSGSASWREWTELRETFHYYSFEGQKLYITWDDQSQQGRNIYILYTGVNNTPINCNMHTEVLGRVQNVSDYSTDDSGISNNGHFNIANTFKEVDETQQYGNEWLGSTIPIFNINDANYQQNLDKYLNDGDMSGAVNREDCEREPEHDNGVELPHNMHLASGYKYSLYKKNHLDKPDKDVVLTWDQTVDTSNYVYQVDMSLDYQYILPDNTMNYTSTYDRIKVVEYGGVKEITCNISADTIYQKAVELSSRPSSENYTCYVKKINLRIRNVQDNKCSNWVNVSIDLGNASATANETDTDGNEVASDEYDYKDIINGDDVDTDTIGKLSDFSSIITFIKSGLGVFGNNGLVALLSSFFGGIFPAVFWKLILTGMGVLVLVGIINFMLKR